MFPVTAEEAGKFNNKTFYSDNNGWKTPAKPGNDKKTEEAHFRVLA